MKKFFVVLMTLICIFSVGCENAGSETETVQTSGTVLSTDEEEVPEETLYENVIFGEYGLELSASGDMEYVGKFHEENYRYLFENSAPGTVFMTSELETVMKNGSDDNVYAIHLIGFAAELVEGDIEFVDSSVIAGLTDKGRSFTEYEKDVTFGNVLFLNKSELEEIVCPDGMRIAAGLAVNSKTYSEEEFDDVLSGISETDTVPVYVYYSSFDGESYDTDEDLYTNPDRIYERIEKLYNSIENSEFQGYLSDGTILEGLKEAAKDAGISDSDVIYTPELSRFQVSMTSEQIQKVIDDYKVEIRYN